MADELEKTCENCKYEYEDMEGIHCRHCIHNAEEHFKPKEIPIIHGKAELELHDRKIRAKAIDEMVEGIREILECNAIYNIDCIATLAEQLKAGK